MVNQGTNNAFVFRYFLSKVYNARDQILLYSNLKFRRIIDNARIHKTDIIKEYSKINSIHLTTISTYLHSLNAAESIFQLLN